MAETKNVFISHVHEDDEVLPQLKALLARSGYKIRDSSINSARPNDAKDPGYIKSEILAPRIQGASCMLVLISPDTHTSEWVDWEIEYAVKQGIRVVGVFVRGALDSDLPDSLEQLGDGAVVGWDGDALVDAIEARNSDWTTADGRSRSEREIPRYSCA